MMASKWTLLIVSMCYPCVRHLPTPVVCGPSGPTTGSAGAPRIWCRRLQHQLADSGPCWFQLDGFHGCFPGCWMLTPHAIENTTFIVHPISTFPSRNRRREELGRCIMIDPFMYMYTIVYICIYMYIYIYSIHCIWYFIWSWKITPWFSNGVFTTSRCFAKPSVGGGSCWLLPSSTLRWLSSWWPTWWLASGTSWGARWRMRADKAGSRWRGPMTRTPSHSTCTPFDILWMPRHHRWLRQIVTLIKLFMVFWGMSSSAQPPRCEI